jgi:phosphatidate cytidylyltransferase
MILHVAGFTEAFASPVTGYLVAAVVAVVGLATLAIGALTLGRRGTPSFRRELWLRLASWLVLLPAMILPVLAGKAWLILAVTLLGLLCLREYSRATGLFREPVVQAFAVLGLLLVNFAALDNWYNFFVALTPLVVSVIAICSIPLDRPAGYIQRTALGIFGFVLFGSGLAHLGFMANDPGYRPLVLLLLLSVALSDVLAFTTGKLIGGPKLIPATSPGKTRSGALGALVGTTLIVALIGHAVFAGTAMDSPILLIVLGILVGLGAQFGDLMLSSIKRDLGIKDMGVAIPGHGGILDRFNSLLLVAPAVFHLVNYVNGIGNDAPVRVITGG